MSPAIDTAGSRPGLLRQTSVRYSAIPHAALPLSAVSVVLHTSYLAYLCTPAADTRSMPLELRESYLRYRLHTHTDSEDMIVEVLQIDKMHAWRCHRSVPQICNCRYQAPVRVADCTVPAGSSFASHRPRTSYVRTHANGVARAASPRPRHANDVARDATRTASPGQRHPDSVTRTATRKASPLAADDAPLQSADRRFHAGSTRFASAAGPRV